MADELSRALDEHYARMHRGAQNTAPQPCSLSGVRPNKSRALKVNRKDRAKAMEHAAQVGVPTHFDAEGHPVFESRNHQKRYLKAYGFHNQDGGYGD